MHAIHRNVASSVWVYFQQPRLCIRAALSRGLPPLLTGLGLDELQVRADDTRQPPAGDRDFLSKEESLRTDEKK